ncbi:MAG TPA: LytTR family DNA-binding domain-containing protein [Burkholderiaceae bacterium]
MRAVIADDEPLLRAELRERLGRLWPALQIVGEAGDGRSALTLVVREQPDIVFLDVSMPRLDGLAVAQQLREQSFGGAIVIVTAYDEYALRAFEQRAIDYLVKPLEDERLRETVERLQQRSAMGTVTGTAAPLTAEAIDALRAALAVSVEQALRRWPSASQPSPEPMSWVRVSRGSEFRLVPVDEIACFRAVPGYTQVVTAAGEHLIAESLAALLPRLDARSFVQVHRSAIVNLRYIATIRRERPGRFVIELKHGLGRVEASRARSELLRDL